MKLQFNTIMNIHNEYVWRGIEDSPDTCDRPVLLKPEEADEYLKDLIDECNDCGIDIGPFRIVDVIVEVLNDPT